MVARAFPASSHDALMVQDREVASLHHLIGDTDKDIPLQCI